MSVATTSMGRALTVLAFGVDEDSQAVISSVVAHTRLTAPDEVLEISRKQHQFDIQKKAVNLSADVQNL